MDEYYELNGISFVWDRVKPRRNLAKHGVAFEQAAEVFFDPFLRLAEAGAGNEARASVIGMDESLNLLFIVHLVVEDEQIRIISARRTTRKERGHYED